MDAHYTSNVGFDLYPEVMSWVECGVYDEVMILKDLHDNWGMTREQARSILALCVSESDYTFEFTEEE